MTDTAPSLPPGWRHATLPELVADDGVLTDGDWVESIDQDPDGEVRLTQLADVGDGHFRDRSDRYMTRAKAVELRCTYLQKGDVLIARMPDPLGRACLFPGAPRPCVTVVDVCIVRPGSAPVHTPWLMHFINAPQFRAEVASLQAGSTRKRISKANLSTIALPVPPPAEQREIAAAIDSHFSRLDAATATLERVQRNLERYRASVLKAAVEGRLVPTEAELAKKEGRSYEPASVLLKRILAERRRRWEEAELAKLKAKGKPPTDDRWKSRYEEPAPPDTDGLPELPEGWCWATADALTDPTRAITYGVIKLGDEVSGGVPVLRSSNVRHLHLDVATVKCIAPKLAEEYSRTTLQGGEIVVTVRGTLGGVTVVPSECRGWNVSREVAMLAVLDGSVASAFACFIAAPPMQRWLTRHEKGITYVGVNIEALKRLPVPVPPRSEALRIAEAVERSLSIEAELRSGGLRSVLRLKVLKQAVLKSAFEGRLVPSSS